MSEKKRRPRSSNRPRTERKKPPVCALCGEPASNFVLKTDVMIMPNKKTFSYTCLECPKCDWRWTSPEQLEEFLTNYKNINNDTRSSIHKPQGIL